MKKQLWIFLIFLAACTPKESLKSTKNLSLTTKSALSNSIANLTKAKLLANKGQPIDQQSTSINTDAIILTYAGNEQFQIEGDKVTGHFRAPVGDEQVLNYWRNEWKGIPTAFVEANDSTAHHKIYELHASEDGLAVVYDSRLGKVTRVIEYAQ